MLEIQALMYHDLPPIVPVRGVIPKGGGTLGRDEENALMLPAPMKSISRLHLQFSPAAKGLYKVSNISSGNQAFVNDKELHSGKGCVLKEGDKILIGGYVLQAHYMEGEEPEQAPAAADKDTDDPEKDDFLSMLLESESEAKPDAESENVSDSDPFAYESKAVQTDPIQTLNERGLELSAFDNSGDKLINIHDDARNITELLKDPLASAQDALKSDNESLDPLAFFGNDSGGDLNSILQINVTGNPLESLAIADAPPSFAKGNRRSRKKAQPAAPPTASTAMADDFDRFLERADSPSVAVKIADETKAADVSDTAKPSRRKTSVCEKTRAVSSVKLNKTAAPSSQDAETLYQAFIEGLGIDGLPGREAFDDDFIRLVGRLFRGYVQGTVDLVASRALTKQEVRANVTLIAPERNNPLKFSPDASVALMHLLGKRIPGFMEPDEAVEQAFLDLRAHQIGLISGMQSALNHVLDRFNPNVIGDDKPVQGMFGDILSLWRKAKLWDDYGLYFHKTRESASDHFQSFFGAAFLEAYEKAISRIRPGEREP
jgi:type VI secretion system FHA domain protein